MKLLDSSTILFKNKYLLLCRLFIFFKINVTQNFRFLDEIGLKTSGWIG